MTTTQPGQPEDNTYSRPSSQQETSEGSNPESRYHKNEPQPKYKVWYTICDSCSMVTEFRTRDEVFSAAIRHADAIGHRLRIVHRTTIEIGVIT